MRLVQSEPLQAGRLPGAPLPLSVPGPSLQNAVAQPPAGPAAGTLGAHGCLHAARGLVMITPSLHTGGPTVAAKGPRGGLARSRPACALKVPRTEARLLAGGRHHRRIVRARPHGLHLRLVAGVHEPDGRRGPPSPGLPTRVQVRGRARHPAQPASQRARMTADEGLPGLTAGAQVHGFRGCRPVTMTAGALRRVERCAACQPGQLASIKCT